MMDDEVYMFKQGSYFSSKVTKLRFEVSKIRGITKNISVNSNQFCIHLIKLNDEVIESPDRFNVIEAIKFVYFVVTGRNLKIYQAYSIPSADKADFDMKLYDTYLMPQEDLFNELQKDPAKPTPNPLAVVKEKTVDLATFEFVKNKPIDTLQ